METTATQNETKTRLNVFEVITDKITKQLEAGNVPWQKLWDRQPTNLVTGKPYRGMNAILLGMEEYENNWFLSFNQVSGIGGKVKKDSKGHPVMYWRKPTADEIAGGKNEGSYDYHYVFNVAQCDKLPDSVLAQLSEKPNHPSPAFILEHMPNPPKILHQELKAWYDVVEDTLYMPKKNNAKKTPEYHAMLFKQLIHSTGHDSRLARNGIVEMAELSSEPRFSKEDLVAEIGLCFLMSLTGMQASFKNWNGYMPGWLAKCKDNKRLVSIAAGEAQKAVDYILNSVENSGSEE